MNAPGKATSISAMNHPPGDTAMIGAIAGDIIGSVYEFCPIRTKDFPLFGRRCTFTDDTVLTVAIAKAILDDGDYLASVLELGRRYPDSGWGARFGAWLREDDPKPYGSWGNGSAMRVAPVGWAFDDAETVLGEAARSAAISHDHPEGIKGAQATALAVLLARSGAGKDQIRQEITERFDYDLNRTVNSIRPTYGFDESCQRTVPEAMVAFLDSDSYEDAVRGAVSLGGDADTLACIAGGIAEAHYGPVPAGILQEVRDALPPNLWSVTEAFCESYCPVLLGRAGT